MNEYVIDLFKRIFQINKRTVKSSVRLSHILNFIILCFSLTTGVIIPMILPYNSNKTAYSYNK